MLNQKKENKLARKYNMGTLLLFSLPSIITMMFMSLYTMVDGVFVSRLLGTNALAAINLVFPLSSIVYAVGIMLATGGSAVVARKMGEKKYGEASEDFSLIVVVGVVIGVVLTVTGIAALRPILLFLGADAATYQYCHEYAFSLLWFTIPSILQMLFQVFLITAGKPAIGMGVTILGGIANIILDYVFIHTFNMGIRGAALATGIGYCIPACFGLAWFVLNRKGSVFLKKPVWRQRVFLQTLGNGSSEMVTNFSTALITFLFNSIMMKFEGPDGVAAITIVMYAEYLLVALYLGYSSGIAPVLSYNYGAGNKAQLKRLFQISIVFIVICSVVTFAGAIRFAENMAGVFTRPGSSVFDLAVHGCRLYAFCYLFKGINIFASSLFTALSDGITSALLSLLRTLVFIVLGITVLPLFLQVDGVWLAVPFAEVLSIFLALYCFKKRLFNRWLNKGKSQPAFLDKSPERP